MNDFRQGLRAIVLAVTRAAVELVRQRSVPFRRGQYPPAVEDAAGRFGDFLDRVTAASALAAAVTALTVLTVWRLVVSAVLWSVWRTFRLGRQAVGFAAWGAGRLVWLGVPENADRLARATQYRKWLRQSNGTAAARRVMVCIAYNAQTPPPETLLWVMGAEDDRVRRWVYGRTTAQQRVALRRQANAEDERRRLALRLALEAVTDTDLRASLLKIFDSLRQRRVVERADRRRWKELWATAWWDRHAPVLEAREAGREERARRHADAVEWWSRPKVKAAAGMVLAGVTAAGLFVWCVARSPAVTWAAVAVGVVLVPLALCGRAHTAAARRQELIRLAREDQEAARREASKKR